jgi:hypothetical protein
MALWSTLKFKFSIKSVEKEFLFNQRKIVSSKNSLASISFGFENVTKSHCWGFTKMPSDWLRNGKVDKFEELFGRKMRSLWHFSL